MTSAIDLKRFNQVFFEECAEHLADMERILVSLGEREPDREELDAIFRAAHSIKGGAGIFGFDDMTAVTHVMESLLDKIRGGEIPFAPSMIDLFLQGGDVIAMQLAGHRDGTPVREEPIAQVTEALKRAMGQGEPEHAPETSALCAPGLSRYHIVFTPALDMFRRGVRVENMIAELADLSEGGLFSCRALLPAVPELEGFDPESCITRWEFTITTAAHRDDLLGVFLFAADEEELSITPLPPSQPAAGTPPTTPRREVVATTAAPAEPSRSGPNGEGTGNGSAASIRVNVAKVDQLINQVGELLITQAMLSQAAATLDPILHEALQKSVAQLERNTRDLQGSVMSIRLVPISVVFNRFPRMVREIAAKLGKSVELRTSGDSTELDKGLIEKISDPLSHLVRNALDHGMETMEARVATGKSPTGTLQVSASQVGGRIVVEVADDGAGLNRERILAKAVERGIPCSESMADEEVWQLIFMPGFSTAEAVTDISGRGVGMDVVLKNVQAIGGRVQIHSQQGKGTRVTISLPLTLAIVEGLSVAAGGEKFIIPLNVVIESLQPKPEQLKSMSGKEMVQVRGDFLPIVRLHRLFDLEHAIEEPERGILVLVAVDGERVALLVDALLDEQQVVVKSMETNFRKVEGSAGATILGDGKVALILDVAELLAMQKKTQK